MNQRGTLYLVCDLNYTFAGEGKYVVALSSFRKDFVVNKVQNYGSLLSVLFDIFFLWSSFSLSLKRQWWYWFWSVDQDGSIVVEEYLPMAWHTLRLNQIAVIHGSAPIFVPNLSLWTELMQCCLEIYGMKDVNFFLDSIHSIFSLSFHTSSNQQTVNLESSSTIRWQIQLKSEQQHISYL